MQKEYHVYWEVDRDEVTEEQIEATITDIRRQIERQKHEDVVTGQVYDFDIVTGAAATYIIGVSSALTAQAIVSAAKSLSETERATIKENSDTQNTVDIDEIDVDIEINIEESVEKTDSDE